MDRKSFAASFMIGFMLSMAAVAQTPCTLVNNALGLEVAGPSGGGLTGTAVTNGALGPAATRTDWTQVRSYLNNVCGAGFSQ